MSTSDFKKLEKLKAMPGESLYKKSVLQLPTKIGNPASSKEQKKENKNSIKQCKFQI